MHSHPHICAHTYVNTYTPQKIGKEKKNLTTKQKAKDLFPEARKNGTDSSSTNGTGGSLVLVVNIILA